MPKMKQLTREEIRMLRQRLRERAATAELRLPDAILDIRKSLGMTQEKFAELAGVTKRQIAEIETGKGNPTVETLHKIGRLFGFTLGFVPKDGGRPPVMPSAGPKP